MMTPKTLEEGKTLATAALAEIAAITRTEYQFPVDWHEQIAACEKCERYKGHPIQQGICDTHREVAALLKAQSK